MPAGTRWMTRVGVLSLALACAGCNGPKDNCEGTLNSYAGCINGQDWDCILELMHPAERAKYGDRKIKGMMMNNWFGTKNYKWKYLQADTAKAGDICVARTIARWDTKVRGKKEVTTDDYGDTFTLHPKDGVWYIDVPGSQKIGGF
jgi:hypothetical protein